MKTTKHHIEVKHANAIARYLIQVGDLESNPPEGYTQMGFVIENNLSPSRRTIYNDIKKAILAERLATDLNLVYFKQTDPIYADDREAIVVTIENTNAVLYNTPINLMVMAACTNDVNPSFHSDKNNQRIVQLERGHTVVGVLDMASDFGAYYINNVTDSITINEISTRSIQFIHFMKLVNCTLFKQRMTNGNLLLAYADAYHANLDDDIINIANPVEYVDSILYDQFTGSVEGNIIEVHSSLFKSMYAGNYEANELDSMFVELLQMSIKARLT